MDNELDNPKLCYNQNYFKSTQKPRDYLRMETTPDMLLDVNDAWSTETQKITIVKTGTSAELVITDLQIRGTGYGSVSLSRLVV